MTHLYVIMSVFAKSLQVKLFLIHFASVYLPSYFFKAHIISSIFFKQVAHIKNLTPMSLLGGQMNL